MEIYPIIVGLILGLNTLGSSNAAEEKGSCTTSYLDYGYINRDLTQEESAYYSCNTGYKTVSGNWWGAATCNNGHWSNEPRCIQKEKCGVLPIVQHGHLKETIAGQSAEIVCDPGYKSLKKSIKCDKGTWESFTCEDDDKGCVFPTRVENAVIISKPQERYSSGSHVTYKCHIQFRINGDNKVFCRNSVWDKAPTCEGSICPPPPLIKDGDYIIEDKKDEVITKVSYSCQSYYVLKEPKKLYSCRDGIWDTPPKCLNPCKLTREIYKEYNLRPVRDNYIRHSDEEIELDCNEGWNAGGFRKLDYVKGTCSDGKITINKKCDTKNIFG